MMARLAMKALRWLRCHVLSLHRANLEDFYEACIDCGYWEANWERRK